MEKRQLNKIVEQNCCNGCEACLAICPKKVITMQRDINGFFYPTINEAECVDCGMCGRICPSQNKITFRRIDYNDTVVFGGYNQNLSTLKQSSSGGFFGIAASKVIEQGGIVFGVVFDEDYRSVHYISSDETSIEYMCGSKYVTARKDGVYQKVHQALKENRQVLFVGLPCEIYALYAYLKKDFELLLTCELICAGASSYNLLDAQLDWVNKTYKSTVMKFQFRYKKYGWVPCTLRADLKNGKNYTKMLDETIFGIGMKYAKRIACFNCKFKDMQRVADFTIGDFWNIDKKASYYNENGTSVVFARTKKAEDFLWTLDKFLFEKVEPDTALNGNRQQLKYAAGVPEGREEFFKILNRAGSYDAFKNFRNKQSILKKIKNSLPAPVYRIIRKVETKFN